MAVCKRKRIAQEFIPKESYARSKENPDTYNSEFPSWRFSTCDKDVWTFDARELFDEILPKLREFESMTWNEILIRGKKQHHSIEAEKLNPAAQERLDMMRIEAEAIVSLRLQATHRLYGYRIGSVFYVLWYDKNHGDNNFCVCRSYKK